MARVSGTIDAGTLTDLKQAVRTTMIFDTYARFISQDFVFKIARARDELDGF